MNSKFLLGLTCVWIGAMSCNDEESLSFTSYYISGLHTVEPERTLTYYIRDGEGDFTWNVDNTDLAEIVSSAGADVEVYFKRSGNVVLSVDDGSNSGQQVIRILAMEAQQVNVAYGGSGVLSQNTQDTVFVTFDAPLLSTPELTINGLNANDTSAFYNDDENKAISPFNSSGETLSILNAYKDSETVYYAIYKAGIGNGQPEARLETITISDTYGGDVADSVYLKLPTVDNVAPVGAIKLSEAVANDSTEVKITVTFNEAMRPMMASKADTLVFADISGGGVETVRDTLWATDDPAIWALNYLTNGSGEGTLTVSIDGIVDLGGNAPASLPSANLTIDNTPPVADGSVSVLPDSRAVSIDTDGRWLWQVAGSDAPTTLNEFASGGSGNSVFVAKPGTYDVYFIAVDEAGNVSAISSQLDIVISE